MMASYYKNDLGVKVRQSQEWSVMVNLTSRFYGKFESPLRAGGLGAERFLQRKGGPRTYMRSAARFSTCTTMAMACGMTLLATTVRSLSAVLESTMPPLL